MEHRLQIPDVGDVSSRRLLVTLNVLYIVRASVVVVFDVLTAFFFNVPSSNQAILRSSTTSILPSTPVVGHILANDNFSTCVRPFLQGVYSSASVLAFLMSKPIAARHPDHIIPWLLLQRGCHGSSWLNQNPGTFQVHFSP